MDIDVDFRPYVLGTIVVVLVGAGGILAINAMQREEPEPEPRVECLANNEGSSEYLVIPGKLLHQLKDRNGHPLPCGSVTAIIPGEPVEQ